MSASARPTMDASEKILARLAVSRRQALMRAFVRLLFGMLLGSFLVQAYGGLRFTPTGASNRLTDYALAIAMLPFTAGTLALLWAGLRWLALAFWPMSVRMEFSGQGIAMYLGPFGRCFLDAGRLKVQYPHEMDSEETDEVFEAFEDPEIQERTRVPHLVHPDYPGRVDLLMLRYGVLDEPALAETLRPFVAAVRHNLAGVREENS